MWHFRSVSRRAALTRLVALGCFGAGYAGGASAAAEPPPSTRALLAVLGDRRASARIVGRAYLAGVPAERDTGELTALLLDEAPALGRAALRGDPAEIRATVNRCCSDDFARARTVRVGGWVISLTEARLCALQALAT